MDLFFHDVGMEGAKRDFPKTVFGLVSISDISKYIPEDLRDDVLSQLNNSFPSGFCNCWGVPAGAASVIKRLSIGDAVLLIRTTGGQGDIPALCVVKAYWKVQLLELSRFLWDSERFPYIFFFNTEAIQLTWVDFKSNVNYLPRFRPAGNFYRLNPERLNSYDGVKNYLLYITDKNDLYSKGNIENNSKIIAEDKASYNEIEYAEGVRLFNERSYFSRNQVLIKDAKLKYGFKCQVCEFSFAEKYAELGEGYIECHHTNPLSERSDFDESKTKISDIAVVCANCHRMLHRKMPALTIQQLKDALVKNI